MPHSSWSGFPAGSLYEYGRHPEEATMQVWNLRIAMILLAATGSAAEAQGTPQTNTGVPTATQERIARGDAGVPWDLLGLLGLVGLLGLRKRHAEDGYHPSSID